MKEEFFKKKWENSYFFTAVSDTSHCLICQKKIAVMKEYNLRQYYKAMHQDKYNGYKSNARKEKVKQLKSSLCKQRSFFANIKQSNENSIRRVLL